MPGGLFLLRPGALGDTLLLAPALAALRRGRPELPVTLAGHPGATRLLAEAGLVDRALTRDDPRLAPLFGEGGNHRPVAEALGLPAISAAWLRDRDGLVAANLARLCGEKVVVAPSQPPPDSGRHVAEHLADALRQLGLIGDALPDPPLLRVPEEGRRGMDAFLESLPGTGKPLLAVHPGSGGRSKNWRAAGFAATADALAAEATVVALGGPADDEALEAMLRAAKKPLVVARNHPLPLVAALLARCAAFLGNDSGLSHLAALLGTPVVALFGPTDPALWRPWGPRARVLSWAAGPDSLAVGQVVEAVRGQFRG